MHHYTYILFNQITSDYYIGVRSSKLAPDVDPYRGSSSVLGSNPPQEWEKYIIQTYSTRKEANKDEMLLIKPHLKNGKCINKHAGWNVDPQKTSEISKKLHADPVFRKNYMEGRKKTFTDEWRENNSQAQLKRFKDPEKKKKFLEARQNGTWTENQRKAFSIPCTIDGITWYESRKQLAAALGWGKNGARHPNFQYKDNKVGSKKGKAK